MLRKLDETREQQNNSPEVQKADQSLNALAKDGKIYLPVSFLSNEFGYASDHITRLARQSKIQAICQDKRWYATRDSLIEYREQAKQNKINGGLKSTLALSGRLQKKIPKQPASFSGDDKVVLSNFEPVSKREVQKKFTFGNTLETFSNHLNAIGEYLSKARIKTAGRALITSAVFLILIFNAVLGMKVSNVDDLSANFLTTAFCKIISFSGMEPKNCRYVNSISNVAVEESSTSSSSRQQTSESLSAQPAVTPPPQVQGSLQLRKELIRRPLPRRLQCWRVLLML